MKLLNWSAAVALCAVSGGCAVQASDGSASEGKTDLVATSEQHLLEVEPGDGSPPDEGVAPSMCPDARAGDPCVYQTETHGPLYGAYSNRDDTCRVGTRAFAGHFHCPYEVGPEPHPGSGSGDLDLPPLDTAPPDNATAPCVPSQDPSATPCSKDVPFGDLLE